jgi:hypothetical protein
MICYTNIKDKTKLKKYTFNYTMKINYADVKNDFLKYSNENVINEFININLFSYDEITLNKKIQDDNKSNNLVNMCTILIDDINQNQKKLETEYDKKNHIRKNILDVDIIFISYLELFSDIFYEKNITIIDIKNYLSTKKIFSYIELLENGLKHYINKDYLSCIESLSIKFEGCLRKLIQLNGGITTKYNNRNNTYYEELLEDLLANDILVNNNNMTNDLILFNYVLTKNGLNIRNDVAHSFPNSKEYYSQKKATMLLLCILKLSKL